MSEVDPRQRHAQEALMRVLGPAAASKIDVDILGPAAADRYRIHSENGRVRVEATNAGTVLVAVRQALAARGESFDEILSTLSCHGVPLPTTALAGAARLPHRYYGNDTDDAYTGAYRDWSSWERQLDGLAGRGFNEIFIPVGAEAVYYDLLTRYGYSVEEALAWIPLPTHQPWWLLQNLAGYPAGITLGLVERRAELGRRIADRVRELGMRPVLPGFSGMVPRDFRDRHPATDVIVTSKSWQSFDRPGWLVPTDPLFPEIAAAYYEATFQRLGPADHFKADMLHEGGDAGGADVTNSARAVQTAMLTARPGATWVMLGWQHNPPSDVIAGIDPANAYIVDGLSDRYPGMNREVDFGGIEYAFGGIWNFGGDTATGAQIATWNTRFWDWRARSGSNLTGIAAIPEGGRNNSAAVDFLAELAWSDAPVDLAEWFASWATGRYGVANASAITAWQTIARTAYTLPDDNGFSEPHDSLFAAWPAFDVRTASSFSPREATYDTDTFASALPALLAATPELGDHPAFRFDVADVSRQVLADTARTLLPHVRSARAARDAALYDRLTGMWIEAMELLDAVTGTHELWLLGRLLDEARSAGRTREESDLLERSQRLIISSWGPQAPATRGGLSDYAGRDIQGLVRTLYLSRWRLFFAAHRPGGERARAPRTEAAWWRYDQNWVDSTARDGIRSEVSGDPIALGAAAVSLHGRIASATAKTRVRKGRVGRSRG